jgi:predicted glycogen debranching enzyme
MAKPPEIPSVVRFGRETCGDLQAAERREWLVTNGLGGYACGTIAGTLTRRYHSLLMAALPPPWNRTLLVAKIDELVEYQGNTYALGANRWSEGTIDPTGFRFLEGFELQGTSPVWTYALAGAQLEKRVWMEPGENTTYVQYRLMRGAQVAQLSGKVLANWRGQHNLTRATGMAMDIQAADRGLRVQAMANAPPFYLRSADAQFEPAHTWYRNYELAAESERGLDHQEDHLHAATFHATLRLGESVTLVLSTYPGANLDGAAARQAHERADQQLLEDSYAVQPRLAKSPAWIRQLILAAGQFVITRSGEQQFEAASVIAGYPWFGEWGRDTMIALPGLLLATGRATIAANVLREYARFVNQGMLPNQIPEAGATAEYNTVDAGLWFFEAARHYHAATGDLTLIEEIFPALGQIIDAYAHGTRFGICVDPKDGLLSAGKPGVQLTWMDAKIGDWVVTPRAGKPVEVNALWINALGIQARFAEALGRPGAAIEELEKNARKEFERFWNPDTQYCFDVLDGPAGNDATLRPNQIFAVTLGNDLLAIEQRRAVVEVCQRELLTSFGMRSLSPRNANYRGHYAGDVRYRDSSYHQGTVWGWLMGPFVQAYLTVTGDAPTALSFLAPFENHLRIHGLGTASEIFDGDPPFAPHGCFAQAWTVAEILRAWLMIANWKPVAKSKRPNQT